MHDISTFAPDEWTRAPHSLWQQDRLALTLALISGYVDAYGFLRYKIYVSFMSGNTTQTALHVGSGNLSGGWLSLLAILAFVLGVSLGTLVLHSCALRPTRWLFTAVAALLVTSVAVRGLEWLGIAILATAIGMVTTSVTRVGAQPVSVGFITGSLHTMAQHLALALKDLPVPQAEGAWDTHSRRATLLAGMWTALLIGALAGGVVTPRLAGWTLLPPIGILLGLALAGAEHSFAVERR